MTELLVRSYFSTEWIATLLFLLPTRPKLLPFFLVLLAVLGRIILGIVGKKGFQLWQTVTSRIKRMVAAGDLLDGKAAATSLALPEHFLGLQRLLPGRVSEPLTTSRLPVTSIYPAFWRFQTFLPHIFPHCGTVYVSDVLDACNVGFGLVRNFPEATIVISTDGRIWNGTLAEPRDTDESIT